ncbi:MAG: DNA-directed RNA polymerase subunit beta [Deltaproteobacteria bacterium]|nr:MAG: DNA-directed RNA polymerase subunit beta [Deltaproteobacteria bacterium]
MAHSIIDSRRLRRHYGKIKEILEISNLIDIQLSSYEKFLQKDVPPEERKDIGLQGVFKQVFPIKDFYETAELRFVKYHLGKPKYDVKECLLKGITYAAPLRVTIQLIIYDVHEGVKTGQIKAIKEQEVYYGEVPLMTDTGTFIINGTERVIVSQLHRSPGVFFDQELPKTHMGRPVYFARIIPYRGSWIDLEFDQKDILYVRIDRRRKIPVTVFLKALGYSTQELLDIFYTKEKITVDIQGFRKRLEHDLLVGHRALADIIDPKTKEPIVKKNRKITEAMVKKLAAAGIFEISVEPDTLVGRVTADNMVDHATGEILVEINQALTEENIKEIRERGIKEFEVLFLEDIKGSPSLRETLLADKIVLSEEEKEQLPLSDPATIVQREQEKAIIEIYRRLRPGDPPTLETARALFNNLFFNPERYDLSKVGRMKINHKLGLDVPMEVITLRREDILEVVKYLISLKEGRGGVDDIDHLGNRRVRTVGELLENQFHIGLVRVERAIKERMTLQEVETLMPHDLINSKPLTAVVREFFGSSQLSQFMDQTNPLSEITHKRRLSALGPGGLTRERAGFEVRDVHPSHYGRICPIETPEGPNIGLIVSLSTYARVNEYGFIETPYRKVEGGRVTDQIEYLFALDEERYTIAQANASIDKEGRFTSNLISARKAGESVMVKPEEVDYMDVSPRQLVSVASSLIPFLENDDANRALMGSNMQRQAVSLLRTEAPLIGTGMERIVARDSGVAVMSKRQGVVESVDASRIVVKAEEDGDGVGVDIYNLTKYQRSNQGTCINQKPIVAKGERIEKGEVVADGPSTNMGELALGRNVLVAFMPWGGYNFEDSILVSEKILKEDIYSSIHIEELECAARETKLGREEITRDIPNVGEEMLKDLDESGIIRIGAEAKPADILVGKITPKGETQLSPEEKLLRAIFGEKASDVKDTSLRIPHGIEGVVIDAKVFTRRGAEKDKRAKEIEDEEARKIVNDRDAEIAIIETYTRERIRELLVGKRTTAPLKDLLQGKTVIENGVKLTEEVLRMIPWERWREISIHNEQIKAEVDHLVTGGIKEIEAMKEKAEENLKKLELGDELPPGMSKVVKVYIAMKRRVSVGDKLSGRHGNKGIVSRILPQEDMPYLEDGTPVDMVLNPLGVPSRMNLGQILETHLGWAAKGLGSKIDEYLSDDKGIDELRNFLKEIFAKEEIKKIIDKASKEELVRFARRLRDGVYMSVPVFDGASEGEIKHALEKAGLPLLGQTALYDGRTGEPFAQKATVGYMYMLKLHHLVDEKIHARSIGPYSLVTQQPLGGKAQFGGQRLGEMEVWALEAYGAAYALQEFLTVKSDDQAGRTRAYEAIVKGKDVLEPGIPESFNVLVKELQGLCLNVELVEEEKEPEEET